MNKLQKIKRLERKYGIEVVDYNLDNKRIIFKKDGREWDINADSITKCKWSFKALSYDSQRDVLNERYFSDSVCKIIEVQKNMAIILNTVTGRKITQHKSFIDRRKAECNTISLDFDWSPCFDCK